MGGPPHEDFHRIVLPLEGANERLVGLVRPSQFEVLGQHDGPDPDGGQDQEEHDALAHVVGDVEGIEDAGHRQACAQKTQTHKNLVNGG